MTAQPSTTTGATPEPGSTPPPPRASFLVANRVTLVAGAVAAALGALVYFGMPHERDLTSLWVLLVKLTPFLAATVAIAWLDVAWAHRLRLHLILPPVCFVVFFAYFVPKIFYYGNLGADFGQLYYTVLILVPFVILSLVLALRLGGGSTSTVLRLSAALMLLQLSGIEDLAFLVVNNVPIPDVWEWADHITVFIGHPPSRTEAYLFIAVHLVLVLLVLGLPDRYFRAALRRPRRRP